MLLASLIKDSPEVIAVSSVPFVRPASETDTASCSTYAGGTLSTAYTPILSVVSFFDPSASIKETLTASFKSVLKDSIESSSVYVHIPLSSLFSQECPPVARTVPTSSMTTALILVEPNSIPRYDLPSAIRFFASMDCLLPVTADPSW